MSTFYDKTGEYVKQVSELENKGDYDNAVLIANEAISYVEGFRSREENPMMQLYYSNYFTIWRLRKQILETNKKIDPVKNETNARLNNLESRIKRLEEQFEKIKNWQDKHDIT
ncbi:MAG: hypothetical protein HY295_06115 [Thaumarchaeota archaeon]|nr:hypothetical protein [Nitrososphaerota archaeon]